MNNNSNNKALSFIVDDYVTCLTIAIKRVSGIMVRCGSIYSEDGEIIFSTPQEITSFS